MKKILCQGRGSAANSAVCYCLGVTAIDPVRMDLLFERFISKERAEPPDIDLDIEHDRREVGVRDPPSHKGHPNPKQDGHLHEVTEQQIGAAQEIQAKAGNDE